MSFWDNETKDNNVVLSPGQYTALVFNCECKLTKTGEPSLSVQYKLNNNARLWQNFTFRPSSAKWILWQMGVMGLNELVKNKHGKTEDMTQLRDQYFTELSALVGATYLNLDVTYEDYQGKEMQKIKLLDLSDKLAYESCDISYESSGSKDNEFPAPKIDTNEEIPF